MATATRRDTLCWRDDEDDHEINAAEWIVYDALYAYCQEMVRQGIMPQKL
jgi:hypothetical protein